MTDPDFQHCIALLTEWQRHFKRCASLRAKVKAAGCNPFLEVRTAMKLPQSALASELGLHVDSYRKIERNRQRGSNRVLNRLLEVYAAWLTR